MISLHPMVGFKHSISAMASGQQSYLVKQLKYPWLPLTIGKTISTVCNEYEYKVIFKVDKTGMLYWTVPSRSLVQMGDSTWWQISHVAHYCDDCK